MGVIIWLIVGGVVGWLASIIMRTDAQQGVLLNVIVGIVGALLAGFVVSPMIGVGTINEGISVATVLVSLVGAVSCLQSSICSAAAQYAKYLRAEQKAGGLTLSGLFSGRKKRSAAKQQEVLAAKKHKNRSQSLLSTEVFSRLGVSSFLFVLFRGKKSSAS